MPNLTNANGSLDRGIDRVQLQFHMEEKQCAVVTWTTGNGWRERGKEVLENGVNLFGI